MSAAAWLNGLAEAEAAAQLRRCCGATRWVAGMVARRPFADDDALRSAAEAVWATMAEADVLEAFDHHPQIGEDVAALRKKFGHTSAWSQGEQRSVAEADDAVLAALAEGNATYRQRFGFIFIVCATGKTAAEMLAMLRARLGNARRAELAIAAGEQAKITALRLDKLRQDAD